MSLKPRKFSDLKRSQEEINAKMLKKGRKHSLNFRPVCMSSARELRQNPII